MLEYLVKKLLMILPMTLSITLILYIGLDLMPGDPATYMVSPDSLAVEANIEAIREAFGLNDPLLVRYGRWLINMLRGEFGYSMTTGAPIRSLLITRLPATLELAVAALLISTLLGSIFGLIGAIHQNSIGDHTLTVAGMIGISVPGFFVGLLAILLFGLKLGWLPTAGRLVYGQTGLWSRLPNLIMPSLVLGLSLTAGLMRYARSCMLNSMSKDYMKTARSKGLPEWRVNLLHGFRTALTPVVILLTFRLPILVGGSVIIERVFSWPGIGTMFINAVSGRDYPVIMTVALLTAFMILIASFLVDLFTALLDPRVRLGNS